MRKSESRGAGLFTPELTRRRVLQVGGAVVVGFGGFGCQGGRVQVTDPVEQTPVDGAALYLDAAEVSTLEALTDVFIPADVDAGAVVAQCARAINLLLSAFAFDPPLIFAGGPFSDRGGAPENDFQEFIALDSYEEAAWRLKIEGSQGRAEREFNGPVAGWQQTYRDGLAALDQAAAGYGFAGFAQMPLPTRELLLRSSSDAAIEALVDVAFMHTLDAMYGAPEYGGNQDLAGWDFTGYMGDVQPRGYTDEEVENPDNPGIWDLLPLKRSSATVKNGLPQAALLPLPDVEELRTVYSAMHALMLLHSEELALGLMLNAAGSWRRVREQVARQQARGQHA